MKLELHFTDGEKVGFLQDRGFDTKQIEVEMSYPCYHNDMEYSTVTVRAVYKDGKEYHKPCGYNFGATEWVDTIFLEEASKRLKQLVLGV